MLKSLGFFLKKDFIYFERNGKGGRKKGRKRGRETLMWKRNIDQLPLMLMCSRPGTYPHPSHVPQPGTEPTTQACVPWLGIKLMTFHFPGWHRTPTEPHQSGQVWTFLRAIGGSWMILMWAVTWSGLCFGEQFDCSVKNWLIGRRDLGRTLLEAIGSLYGKSGWGPLEIEVHRIKR